MECVICFAVAMASVMSSRLCLNIRSVAQKSDAAGEHMRGALSTLTFSHTLPLLKTSQRAHGSADGKDVETGGELM